jgi:drug/metabolite transporter (DMT)-like permease
MLSPFSSPKYRGIMFMLVAAAGFSVMGGFAKVLKYSFNAPQLVFYRNLTGLLVLSYSLFRYPILQSGGKLWLLIGRGLMGTVALYTLLYNILHIPLGSALTYNTTNTLFIALLSYFFLKERLNGIAWFCIAIGFTGVLLIYNPSLDFGLKYHIVGIICGVTSALAYLSVSGLNKYYDTRIIVLSFLLSGIALPGIGMLLEWLTPLPTDEFFITWFKLPQGIEWFYIAGMGVAALFGQYFVTKAYSNDKAGIVSAIGYSNIVFALVIGIILGDPFPGLRSLIGILLVIGSGILISVSKR